jgi:hypothetical protein
VLGDDLPTGKAWARSKTPGSFPLVTLSLLPLSVCLSDALAHVYVFVQQLHNIYVCACVVSCSLAHAHYWPVFVHHLHTL